MMPKRRRPPLRHLVAALAVVVGVVVLWGVARRPDEPEMPSSPRPAVPPSASAVAPGPTTPSPSERTASAAETPRAAASPSPPAVVDTPPPPSVRTITGPGIAPLPPAATPPQRVEPPKPPPPPPPPIRPRRLMPVTMEDTATLSAGDIRVRLPGVAVLAAEETCRDRAGTIWPCGRQALAGVRAVVRGKAVECPLPEKVRRGDFVTDCTIAGTDLAERLVASGWARALDRDGPLGRVERAAEGKALGLHTPTAPRRVDALPAPADRPPPDTTTAPLGGGAPPPTRGVPEEPPAAMPLDPRSPAAPEPAREADTDTPN